MQISIRNHFKISFVALSEKSQEIPSTIVNNAKKNNFQKILEQFYQVCFAEGLAEKAQKMHKKILFLKEILKKISEAMS